MMVQSLTLINDPTLSKREIEILEYVTMGLSAKEVARHINISPRTVDRHIESAKLKLRARNRTHMVACAIKAGFPKMNAAGVQGIFKLKSSKA